jgi:hypothetical protein
MTDMTHNNEKIPKQFREHLAKVLSHIEFIGFSNCEIGITPDIGINPSNDPILENLRITQPRDLGTVIIAFQIKLIQLQEDEYKMNSDYKRDTWELLLAYSQNFASEMVIKKLTSSLKRAA